METSKKKTASKLSKKVPTVSSIGVKSPSMADPVAKPKKAAGSRSARTITPEERQKMVEQAAYFRAEKEGFKGDPHQHWLAAEDEVASVLAKQKIKVKAG